MSSYLSVNQDFIHDAKLIHRLFASYIRDVTYFLLAVKNQLFVRYISPTIIQVMKGVTL